ncbi:histone methylation protein DOT1-domain-containing protein [Scleroderma yunnanense]
MDHRERKDLVSAAGVVRQLVKSYTSYFKNLDDSEDKSFEVEAISCTRLECPNNSACETIILLVQKIPTITTASCAWKIHCILPLIKVLFGNLPAGLLSDHMLLPSPSLPPAVDPSRDISKPRTTKKSQPFAFPLTLLVVSRDECCSASSKRHYRSVGPNVDQLCRYSALSNEVYSELMSFFTTNIIAQTGLRADSLLINVGSGVGNMWGLWICDIKLIEDDMLSNSHVDELLPKTDVVLVNNKVFQESLNAALRPKFLYLKEGAVVVCLKPFVQPNARVTKHDVDDICAIFDVEEQSYRSGDVSWGSGGCSYYLHRVDRVGYGP